MMDNLYSTIRINVTLKTNLMDVERTMKAIPNSRILSKEPKLKYEITGKNGKKVELELEEHEVIFTEYFDRKDRKTETIGLIKLLSILTYLKDVYAVEINQLYGNLSSALMNCMFYQKDHTCDHSVLDLQMKQLDESNVYLASEVLRLLEYQKEATKRIRVLEKFLNEVIGKLPQSTDGNLKETMIDFGLSEGISHEISQYEENKRNKTYNK